VFVSQILVKISLNFHFFGPIPPIPAPMGVILVQPAVIPEKKSPVQQQ